MSATSSSADSPSDFSRSEIEDRLDDIVEFAGLQEFIELPMRTYSSGMTARLKFAIATVQDHDILIVDEALAVGDKNFRDRSEARIREIRDNAGTIFLVSHSMQSIRDTCNRVIWLNKGTLDDGRRPRRGHRGVRGLELALASRSLPGRPSCWRRAG